MKSPRSPSFRGARGRGRRMPISASMLLAYLALLNSYELESLWNCSAQKSAGASINSIGLTCDSAAPRLVRVSPSLLGELTDIGGRIARGEGFDPAEASVPAAMARDGCSVEEFRVQFARGEIGELQERLRQPGAAMEVRMRTCRRCLLWRDCPPTPPFLTWASGLSRSYSRS